MFSVYIIVMNILLNLYSAQIKWENNEYYDVSFQISKDVGVKILVLRGVTTDVRSLSALIPALLTSTAKMESVCSSEILLFTYSTIYYHNPQGHSLDVITCLERKPEFKICSFMYINFVYRYACRWAGVLSVLPFQWRSRHHFIQIYWSHVFSVFVTVPETNPPINQCKVDLTPPFL